MIRYFLTLLLSCAIFIGGYAALAYSSMGRLDEQNSYLCQFIDKKTQLAKSLNTPKLLIIAGSNAYTGLSAKLIEESLKIPTFNFGLHAGLNPQFIFYQARQVLIPGDIVLLPLEYEMYYKNQSTDLLTQIIFGCGQEFLQELQIDEQVHLLLTRSFAKIVDNFFFAQTELQHLNFNAWGDANYNQEQQVTPAMRDYIAQELVGIQFDENSAGVKAITDFIQWCHQHNITVFATWPNMAFKPLYHEQYYIKLNLQKIIDFYAAQQVPVIGTAEEAMFDPSYFYDTSYHLHQRGVEMRTLKLLAIANQRNDIVLH